MFQIIENQFIRYPWLSISKNNAGVVVTTKKIGSRFFEDITIPIDAKKHQSTILSIDFTIDDIESYSDAIDDSLVFNQKILQSVANDNLVLSPSDMFKILNISSISELFSVEYLKNNKVFFITRNPIDRFYTGYFEKVDSIVGERYGKLSEQPQEIIDSILNEHILKINYTIFSDEHLSLWNTFLLKLIKDNNLQEISNVIDLNNSEEMKIFNKLDQPSNKIWLDNWLSNIDNKPYINELHSKFKFYFELELESYNKLLNKNYE